MKDFFAGARAMYAGATDDPYCTICSSKSMEGGWQHTLTRCRTLKGMIINRHDAVVRLVHDAIISGRHGNAEVHADLASARALDPDTGEAEGGKWDDSDGEAGNGGPDPMVADEIRHGCEPPDPAALDPPMTSVEEMDYGAPGAGPRRPGGPTPAMLARARRARRRGSECGPAAHPPVGRRGGLGVDEKAGPHRSWRRFLGHPHPASVWRRQGP